jgi:hypothetical protein
MGAISKEKYFSNCKKLKVYKYRENLWNAEGKNIRQHIYKLFKTNVKSAFDDLILDLTRDMSFKLG